MFPVASSFFFSGGVYARPPLRVSLTPLQRVGAQERSMMHSYQKKKKKKKKKKKEKKKKFI